MSLKHDIEFTLNGVRRQASVRVDMSALDMLRDVVGLTGTKYGCGEGECGACTILVDGKSLNSCLLFAVDCDGRDVVTIEGLAAEPKAKAKAPVKAKAKAPVKAKAKKKATTKKAEPVE